MLIYSYAFVEECSLLFLRAKTVDNVRVMMSFEIFNEVNDSTHRRDVSVGKVKLKHPCQLDALNELIE